MPASKAPLMTLSVGAAAAITEFRAVDYDGTVPAAGTAMFGLATTDAAIDEQVAADVMGTSVAEVGGAVALKAELEVGAGGKLVTQTTGVVVAKAMQAAGADGDQIEVFLLPK